MLAMFGEDAYELSEMTVEDWDLLGSKVYGMTNKPSGDIGDHIFWHRLHKTSGARVWISRRFNYGDTLLILWKESKQLCSVPEKAFHDIPAALAFMTQIGEKFAADLVSSKHVSFSSSEPKWGMR
jgi:hypothetical protein